jgi:hypothetical protein
VRGDDDLEAGRPDGREQLPDVLAQADGFGDFPQPRVDLAAVGEEVVVRVDEHEGGPAGVIGGGHGHQSRWLGQGAPVA